MSRYLSSVELNGALPSGAYYAEIPAVKHLEKCGVLAFSKPIALFVGENGTGKSTLLEAIAVAYGFCPEGGSKNFNFSTAIFFVPNRFTPPQAIWTKSTPSRRLTRL